MFAAERRQVILALVRANGAVSLRELAATTGSSEVTIRRDLRQLEGEGLLDRRHGGAVEAETHEASHSEKALVAASEKAAIAELAATMVVDGDAIVIGAGTTTHALARHLVRRRDLTVVTNSLLVAQALAHASGVDVVMTGGTLRGSIYALVGGLAEQSFAGLRTTRAFISGNGLTSERGLSTPNLLVGGVDRAIVKAAREIIVLADHTKIGVDTMMCTVEPRAITTLVTDDSADPRQLAGFAEAGVTVLIAPVRRRSSLGDVAVI